MILDNDIEENVLEYLHLEYGESHEDDDALKTSDLNYEGKFLLEGVPTHYWLYPTSESCWAIIQPFEDTYCFSMSTTSPEGWIVHNQRSRSESILLSSNLSVCRA